MDSHLEKRKRDLEENIDNELTLQKELEDDLRLASDTQEKGKLKKKIKEVKNRINEYRDELNSLYKNKREQESLVSAMTNITFRELQMVTDAILCMSIPTESNFIVLAPIDKMLKNELTKDAPFKLMTGAIQAKMVGLFVETNIMTMPCFAEELKAGFVREYQRLRKAGLKGNDLLDALHKFSCHHSTDYALQAAGLAVLYYLFERCEVFER